jgi:Zn-dependent peptidase ImmA (M78 family)
MFERGFKSWCEKLAVDARKELRLKPHERLDPYALAKHLQIRVWNVEDVPGLTSESKDLLLGPGSSDWSAITLVDGHKKLVILNSSHSSGRLSNDLAHELAHIILGHLPEELPMSDGGISLRPRIDMLQEQQADWLAGSLLLPRPALVHIKKSFTDLQDATVHYGVSRRLLDYRMSVTGVRSQFSTAST